MTGIEPFTGLLQKAIDLKRIALPDRRSFLRSIRLAELFGDFISINGLSKKEANSIQHIQS
jgi:hypothetical protein